MIRYHIVRDIENFIHTHNDFSELGRYQGSKSIQVICAKA